MEFVNYKKPLIVAAIGLAIVILLWLSFRPAAVKVETARVTRGPMKVTVDGEGRTRVRNKFTVTAPVSGRMLRINLNEGDSIPRDYLITEIDPNPPLPRFPGESDHRLNPYAAKVYSPAAGKVLRIFEKSERFVQAGTPLIEIGTPTDLEIVIDVLSSDAVRVKPGSAVLIDDPGSGQPLKARVRTIEPQAVTKVSALGVEEKRVNVVADFVDHIPAFGDNFRVDARIVAWEADNVLAVPNNALFRTGEEWNIFIVEGGQARQRRVAVGRRSNTQTEVVSGLAEDETVILHPPSTLTDGSRVSPD